MSQNSSDFLAPPAGEFSNFPPRNQRSMWDSSVRSRSVPNIRSETRSSDDHIAPSSLIYVQSHTSPAHESAAHAQVDGREDNTEVGSVVVEEPRTEKESDASEDDDGNLVQSDQENQSSLPEQRPRQLVEPDRWSESDTIVPRRNLTVLDVAALIFNKMVGTGIFTTPGAVLAYTKSKPVSLILWAIGGVFSSLFLLVYLEFGSALPFNGGELIYVDEIYPKPELLATILFSGFFLVLGNSYGNSVTFAKHTMLAASPTTDQTTELNGRLVRFIAIVVLSVVCLLHYFSNRFGLFLNKLLALFKAILLFTVFVAGAKAANKEGSGLSDFGQTHGIRNPADGLAAMVLILYAYQGWENANYVAGEIRAPTRTLKIGAFLAVGMVSILYMLVTLAYYLACDYDTITNKQSDLGVAIFFAPKAFGASMGLKVCIGLSAFGNLIAVTFTSSKVKQAIAVQRILPFYKFFQKDINTPKGALVLHWVSSVLLILICPTSADGYSFAVGLFTYGHVIVGIFVTLGLYRLPGRMRQTWPEWKPEVLTNKYIFWVLPAIFSGGNLIVIIWGAKPRDPGKIPRFWWPVIFFLILAGSAIYWGTMMVTRVKVNIHGEERTVGSVVGFEVKIYNETDETVPPEMEEAMVQSRLDGSRRRVGYKFSGAFKAIGSSYRKTTDFVGNFMF